MLKTVSNKHILFWNHRYQDAVDDSVKQNKDNAALVKEEDIEEIDQKDDGYIELVLRVLARMCDGQHEGLQVGFIMRKSQPTRFSTQQDHLVAYL